MELRVRWKGSYAGRVNAHEHAQGPFPEHGTPQRSIHFSEDFTLR